MESCARIEPAEVVLEGPFVFEVDSFPAEVVACLPRLRLLAVRLAGRNEADDLVQATVLRALEKRRQFQRRGPDDLYFWMSRILRHLHLDGWRQRRCQVVVDLDDRLAAEASREIAPWRFVADEELAAAIGALPERLRQTYTLFARGLSYAAISRRLKVSPRTVGVRIFRARSRLRQTLQRCVRGRGRGRAAAGSPPPRGRGERPPQLSPLRGTRPRGRTRPSRRC